MTRPRCNWCVHAFDPEGLANPGKIFPTPRSCGESHRRWQELKAGQPASPLAALEVV